MGCGASLPSAEAFLVPTDDLRCLHEPTASLETIRVAPEFRVFILPVIQTSPVLHGADVTIKAADGTSVLTAIEMRQSGKNDKRYVNIKDGSGALRARMFGTHEAALIYATTPAYEGQQPSAKTKDGTFAWAKMWKKVTSLSDHYMICLATNDDEYEKKGSADLASKLRADAASMRKFVMAPRKRVGMDEVGGLNNEVIDGGILYANRRFFIPWGWYANAVSSLCSTSWSIMEGLVRPQTPSFS